MFRAAGSLRRLSSSNCLFECDRRCNCESLYTKKRRCSGDVLAEVLFGVGIAMGAIQAGKHAWKYARGDAPKTLEDGEIDR